MAEMVWAAEAVDMRVRRRMAASVRVSGLTFLFNVIVLIFFHCLILGVGNIYGTR